MRNSGSNPNLPTIITESNAATAQAISFADSKMPRKRPLFPLSLISIVKAGRAGR